MQGLAGLFQAPSALMFQGTFEEAKAKAVEDGKWLVSSSSLQHWKLASLPFLLSGGMPVEASPGGAASCQLLVRASVSFCQDLHLPAPAFANTYISQHLCLPGQHGLQAHFQQAGKVLSCMRFQQSSRSCYAKCSPCMRLAHQELVSTFAVDRVIAVVTDTTSILNFFFCAVHGKISSDSKG